jgi:aerobic-type carbon monoxide dehydrogenase small subunit (CoxS/CutS family)
MLIKFILNGMQFEREVEPVKTLVNFLREDMGLTSVKKGCEIGECGACTVLMNKEPVSSCMVLTGQIENSEIITLEGVNKEVRAILQEKLLKGGAVQCGYCTPGMVMSILGLLYENNTPTEGEIRRAIDGNLCRCTGYNQIITSVADMHLEELKF